LPFALYLTGAPAVGKSTAAGRLAQTTDAEFLSYGQILTERLSGVVGTQEQLRERSAEVIATEQVRVVDEFVRERVAYLSGKRNLVVDSHAVTAEKFGFRAVPYSASMFRDIGFTHIACLFAPAEVVAARIAASPGGRPVLSQDSLDMHAQLQASLALSYAHSSGLPIAFIDAQGAPDEVVEAIARFVGEA
jgi:adenylate kinase